MWTQFFDEIYLVNLEKRMKRYIQSCDELDRFEIYFKRKNAVERSNGAEGLMVTMIEIFNEAINKGYENILVFEDDVMWVEDVDVNEVMDKVVKQLPKDYLLCYLGCQPSKGYTHFHSPNLLPVTGAYATHAVAYSRKAIELILASNLDYPIDNHFCSHIQEPFGNCYQVHPFLATQREGFSDIGMADINWDVFLSQKHEQKILELNSRR